MVSHGGFPDIDLQRNVAGGLVEPASLNHRIVTELLREELGYKHLVVTDDLEMGAISRHYEIENAVHRAFAAGQDMLLICSRPDSIARGYDALLQSARDGLIPRDRLDATLERIAAFKALTQPPLEFDTKRLKQLSDEISALNQKLNYTYGGRI
jgi:beta-N-acetylhexosaminidase